MKRAIAALAAFALLAFSGCEDMALRNTIIDLVTTRAADSEPEAPSGLSANTLSGSQIHLSWTDNSSNETGFKIERSPDGSSGWTQVFLTSANAASWDDAGLAAGTAYSYRVRASNAVGDSLFSNIATATTYSIIPITLVTISAAGDSFTMGDGSYGPNVSETVSFDFRLSKYEITNSLFAQFIDDGGYSTQTYWTANGWDCKQSQGWTQPSYWGDSSFNGSNQPVVGVSWYEAVAFCNWCSAREGLTTAYDSAGHATLNARGFRLPTEAEWEYAAAKGASGQAERIYTWGDTWDSNKAVCSVAPAHASKTADVGSKSTAGDTPQSLADMSGNVWEWCADNYQLAGNIVSETDRYYFLDDSTSQAFMCRGGAWDNSAELDFRCAGRSGLGYPHYRNYVIGFRVLRPDSGGSGSVPEAPSGLSASSLSVSKIHLSWTDNSSNETGFKIERSPDGSSGWTQVQETGANAVSWDDTGLTIGDTYYYRMRSYNLSAGDSTYSNIAATSTYANVMIIINAANDSFTMGDGSYGPNVSQTISTAYRISKYEITNAEFAGFIADGGYSTSSYWTTNGWAQKTSGNWTQPFYWSDGNFNGANQPVVGVSWYEAVAYCNWRSGKEGLIAAYNEGGHAAANATGYRLPTEVQWEYAAAKGASGQAERIYAWGSAWDSSLAVCSVPPATAAKTSEVGSKSTAGDSPQGLADMSGNVWEWCSDNYQIDSGITAGTDWYYFTGDSSAQVFLFRGGSWPELNEYNFRSAYRYNTSLPFFKSSSYGFRVVRP
jgi:formylglycine-generating enzyme required for sulfatase activity